MKSGDPVIVQNDDVAAFWVKETIGVTLCPPYVGFVIFNEKEVLGAVVINDYADRNCEMSAVGERCWTVPVIRYLARYCFHKLDVRRVTSRTRDSNEKAKAALVAMGFECEGRLRDWYDDEDALVFGLLARNQRLVRKPT